MHDNTVTKDFCLGKVLLFYPRTEHEAIFIHRKIIELGFEYANKQESETRRIFNALSKGIMLDERGMLGCPTKEQTKTGRTCFITQFNEDYAPPEQRFLFRQFNKASVALKQTTAQLWEKLHLTLPAHP